LRRLLGNAAGDKSLRRHNQDGPQKDRQIRSMCGLTAA